LFQRLKLKYYEPLSKFAFNLKQRRYRSADILPNSRGAIVHYGALPAFCSRLLTIEYIDLAGGFMGY